MYPAGGFESAVDTFFIHPQWVERLVDSIGTCRVLWGLNMFDLGYFTCTK